MGENLAKKYILALSKASDVSDAKEAKEAILEGIKNEEDPRYGECMALLHNKIYAKYTKTNENIDLKTIKWQ